MANYVYCNGELYHAHKYITKKKVNGKWRYYYDLGEPLAVYDKNGIKISSEPRVKGYTKWQDIIGLDERDRAYRSKAEADRVKNLTRGNFATDEEYANKDKMIAQKTAKAKKDYEAYTKTLLGRIDSVKKAVNKGKKVVSKFLKKIAKRLG